MSPVIEEYRYRVTSDNDNLSELTGKDNKNEYDILCILSVYLDYFMHIINQL